ncbi:MAG TPA: response regulator transcription factor [Polyangiaceae bacterium]|nr:response regulator transcription factor [Polyangiaceae bacterium]
MSRQRLLVVEDDSEMRSVISLALRAYGYDVSQVATGADALIEVHTRTPDAIILDIGLPDIDGFAVTARIRQSYELPIIVLSASPEELQQIRAFDSGANDYVVKPFREGELMARVRNVLRRPIPLAERRDLTVGDLRLESMQRRVYLRGAELKLTNTEYDLLHVLARNADRVVTHGQLLLAVWGPERVTEVQYLRVFVRALRDKLEEDATQPRRITTVLGVGYRLVSTS